MTAEIPEHLRGRRYYPLSAYLRDRFGGAVRRIPLDAGLTCPNLDGTISTTGCAYCDNRSFRGAQRPAAPVREQMIEGMGRARGRSGVERFIAYFQTFTNTHAPVEVLMGLYDSVVGLPGVVGLAIGTRPDCVGDEVLDLIQSYASRLEVWVEYGLQTRHDRTLAAIGRGHDYAAFADAAWRARQRGIKVCAHVILGLPSEGRAEMTQTAVALAENRVDGVKLHNLHIVRGTRMEHEYLAGRAPVLSAEEYVNAACDFIERLPPYAPLFRLVGEARGDDLLVAPKWSHSKGRIVQMVTEELTRRNSWQGKNA